MMNAWITAVPGSCSVSLSMRWTCIQPCSALYFRSNCDVPSANRLIHDNPLRGLYGLADNGLNSSPQHEMLRPSPGNQDVFSGFLGAAVYWSSAFHGLRFVHSGIAPAPVTVQQAEPLPLFPTASRSRLLDGAHLHLIQPLRLPVSTPGQAVPSRCHAFHFIRCL